MLFRFVPRTLTLPLITALLAVFFVFSPAHAAEKKPDPNKEQIRRLQQAQKRLEQEKAVIAGELDSEKKKVEEETLRAASLQREAGALRAARDQTAAKLAEAEAKLKETQAELARAREQRQQQLQEMQEMQRQADAEKKRLQQELAAGREQYAACVERDRELRKVSATVLELYEKKSCSDSMLQNEPFTGLKRVEIENNVEDLREKLEAPAPG